MILDVSYYDHEMLLGCGADCLCSLHKEMVTIGISQWLGPAEVCVGHIDEWH